MGGLTALPFVLTDVILVEQPSDAISQRALALFAARARRELGLRHEVAIWITSSADLQKLNARYRRKNKPTDVLSFAPSIARSAGDLAISFEIAASNASKLGHSLTTELKILVLHGLLHLAGHDHETDDERMSALETKLRKKFGLPTGLIERTQQGTSPRKSVRTQRVLPPKPGPTRSVPAGVKSRTGVKRRGRRR